MRGQVATENLLPSEQYGLGGFDTVRGYKEREINFDDIIIYNFEIYLPYISFSKLLGKSKKPIDKLEFLGFIDAGYGWENNHAAGITKSKGMYSIGPGVRYSIAPYLTCKLDWGFQLESLGSAGLGGPHQRIHFSAIAGF